MLLCVNIININKRGMVMTDFIAKNWIVIVAVLLAAVVGLVITLFIMDRKDKKLIADYKASLKASKVADKQQPVEEPVEEEDEVEDEVEEPVVDEEPKASKPVAKKPATKTTTAKKATTTKKSK